MADNETSHQIKVENPIAASERVNLDGKLVGKLRPNREFEFDGKKAPNHLAVLNHQSEKDQFYFRLTNNQFKMPRARLAHKLGSDSQWKQIQLQPVDEVDESPVFWSDDEGQHSRNAKNFPSEEMTAHRPKTITTLKARIERQQRRRTALDEVKAKSDSNKGAAHPLSARDSRQPGRKANHKSRRSSSANRKENLESNEVTDTTATEYHSLINPNVTYRRKQNDAQKGRSRSWSRSWIRGWSQAAWLRDELLTQRPRKYHSLSKDSRRVFWQSSSFTEPEFTKQQQLTEYVQTNTRKVATQGVDTRSSSTEVKTKPEVLEYQNPKISTERFSDFWSETVNIYSPEDDTQEIQPEDCADNTKLTNQQGTSSEQPKRLYLKKPKINAPTTLYQLKRNYGYF